jgi:hypothetical protein
MSKIIKNTIKKAEKKGLPKTRVPIQLLIIHSLKGPLSKRSISLALATYSWIYAVSI